MKAVAQPKHQSGQVTIRKIYDTNHRLRQRHNNVHIIWVPTGADFKLAEKAKDAAQRATNGNQAPWKHPYRAKSTTINAARKELKENKTLPEGIGQYSKEMDMALPGKHTRTLYDSLRRGEANILAQLRTGMARLNGYLHRIGAAETDRCDCGTATETIKHFLFRCVKWEAHRTQMLRQTETRRGNLSFWLGGRGVSDPETWEPNMKAVRATIKYAIATGRLEKETGEMTSTPISITLINSS